MEEDEFRVNALGIDLRSVSSGRGGTLEKTLGRFSNVDHSAMPPKKKAAAKKGKAAAKPAYLTDEEHCAPFGLFANDIVTTPLGIRARCSA